jgi:hypothetical protein
MESNTKNSLAFDVQLRTLCKEYGVFIKEVSERAGRVTDTTIFRQYTLSMKIQKEGEARLLCDLIE